MVQQSETVEELPGHDCDDHSLLPGQIQVLASMRIVDPGGTFIKRKSSEEVEIKVLVVPENGGQKLVIFQLPGDGEQCTVGQFLNAIESQFCDEEIDSAYLVSDSIHDVRYVVTVRTKSKCDTKKRGKIFTSTPENGKHTPAKNFRKRKVSSLSCSYAEKNKKIIEMGCIDSDERLSLDLRKNTQVVLTYPKTPLKEGITITIEDFKCLERDQYLNDIIIDFYLKYATREKLSKRDQERIHVFSTYFYTRLANPKFTWTSIDKLQYAEIKKWTKNVNIFEKDFIIIPINQSNHWFLAIICYPASVNLIKERMASNISDDLKHYPCIIIFDSLSPLTPGRPKVAQTLKNFLKCEYADKTNTDNLFQDDIKVVYADVPQQLNSSDCGLYLIQFVEKFFQDFVITNSLELLKRPLSNWFDTDIIDNKREELRKLIIRLAIDSKETKKSR